MVTSRDVAEAAGVSQATVSRVLQDSDKVMPETRRRVLEAMERIGYTPNAPARAMKTRRTGSIGVVVAGVTNPFYPEVLDALNEQLAAAGQRMILWQSSGPADRTALDAIRQGLVDGVVFTTVTSESVALHEALHRGAPVVLVNRGVPGLPCDQVTSDNIAGGRAVATYLHRTGHRRIGYIGGPPLPSTSVEREHGFRVGLTACGASLPAELCRSGDFSHRSGHEAMTAFLAMPDPPTAVFCANDLTAFGAIDGARSLGKRVPDDVWVVGFDDVQMAAWEAFDLTTVRQPVPDMVRLAVQILIERIADPAKPTGYHRFPTELVIRGSTAHTPVPERA